MRLIINILTLLLLLFLYSCKQDCIDVDVPYTEQESYTDTEQETIKLEYNIENGGLYHKRIQGAVLFSENPKLEIYCTVRNISKEGGEFELYATLSSQGDKIDFNKAAYIGAGETYMFDITKEINPYSFSANIEVDTWGINAPYVKVEKEVTKYRDVTKYRKCNTCVENCGEKYKKDSDIPWWGYLIIGVLILGLVRWILEKLRK